MSKKTTTKEETAVEEATSAEAAGALVAQAPPGALATTFDFGEDAGKGFNAEDRLKIPFINVLQSNSPIVENNDVEGAEEGMLYNTVTKELIPGDKGVVFIPVLTEHVYVEWVPRLKGGGFIQKHAVTSPEVLEAIDEHRKRTGLRFPNKENPLKHGANELMDTYYAYVLLLDDAGQRSIGFGIFAFASSKIKEYETWISRLRLLRVDGPGDSKICPPLVANRCVLRTKEDRQKVTNKKFANITIDPLNATLASSVLNPGVAQQRSLILEAQQYCKDIEKGVLKADFEKQGQEPVDAEDVGAPKF